MSDNLIYHVYELAYLGNPEAEDEAEKNDDPFAEFEVFTDRAEAAAYTNELLEKFKGVGATKTIYKSKETLTHSDKQKGIKEGWVSKLPYGHSFVKGYFIENLPPIQEGCPTQQAYVRVTTTNVEEAPTYRKKKKYAKELPKKS